MKIVFAEESTAMMAPLHILLSNIASWRSALVRQLGLLFVVAVAAVSANSAVAEWNTTPETIEQHPTWIYTPSHAMPNGKHLLLIALHGCNQNHDEIKDFGNLVQTAEANGIVVAVPFVGSEFFGNQQQKCWDYDGARDAKGHIVELVKLADRLKARTALNIDPNHVYIVGLSSGAAMALAVGCKAPDVFAGIGAIAGPSVGSSQNSALVDASGILSSNVSNAIGRCKSLAGSKVSHFATQIANIAYGDMDRNGPKAMFDFSFIDTAHAGQYRVVSTKWSKDNVKVLQDIYGTGAPGPEELVQNGLGTQQVATKDSKSRLSLVVVHDVGHAWPAGTGLPNSFSQGGRWIAQSGLNYPDFVVDWLISNNMRVVPSVVGNPEVTVSASTSGATFSLSGTAKDPDGSIARVDTVLLQANAAGAFLQSDSHGNISLGSGGSYSDNYSSLPDGRYRARVTATDNANHTTTELTPALKVGNLPDPEPCRDFTDNNFNHVQRGRAVQCNFGFTCAKGSGDNLGLFSLGITSIVKETSTNPGVFTKGACPTP
jgi:poly(3-hydroxybutyrate) depolymerase